MPKRAKQHPENTPAPPRAVPEPSVEPSATGGGVIETMQLNQSGDSFKEGHGMAFLSYRELPSESQTLYAELLEHLRGADLVRSFADLNGRFIVRERGNGEYIYFRTAEGGDKTPEDFYIGPAGPGTDRLVESYHSNRSNAEASQERIHRLASMLRRGGLTITNRGPAKIIRGLANAGMFRLGGVLVGTHAFHALGNALGVKWASGVQTDDVDFGMMAKSPGFSGDNLVRIGIPQSTLFQADMPKAIEALEMGFIPAVRLHASQSPTTFLVPGKLLRIDFLTTPMGKGRETPVPIPRFKIHAQPLEFLDYLLEETLDATLVANTGILVRIPDPARFAIHKLLVAASRAPQFETKKQKDRHQAFMLMSYLEKERPGDLSSALDEAMRRGPGWERRIREQVPLLPGSIQELRSVLG